MGKDIEWFEYIVIFYVMGLGICIKNLICYFFIDFDIDYKSIKILIIRV